MAQEHTAMTMPGFTAAQTLEPTSGQYRRLANGGRGAGTIDAQLKGGGFRPRLGGTFGTIADYWPCKDACYSTYSSCLDGCEGTLGSPKGSSNCIICDDNYRACLANCSRDIA
jgi:hypothetical protein